ncbi:unnamed protein product [Schistosoma mattheei]|uniref:Uncharacterized protein n=1 Tax=Schistosoma mattheei TaxID=31246 RepID=A0A183NI98_9TREM|nr:unnamed protein product [Schistosoma mattheei]
MILTSALLSGIWTDILATLSFISDHHFKRLVSVCDTRTRSPKAGLMMNS